MSRSKAEGIAPPPPETERVRRLERARECLRTHDLEGALFYGSGSSNHDPIRYLSGYVPVFPRAQSVLLLPCDRPPILLIDREWNLCEAREMSWIGDIRTIPAELDEEHDRLTSALGGALSDAKLGGGRIGIPDRKLPMAISESVSESHPDTDLDVKPEVWSEVVGTPTAYDRDMIAETASIADAGLAEITSACRVGVTEREICLTALERMARLGAEFLHSTAISTHVDIGSYSRGRSNLQPYLFTETKLDMGEMFWVDLIVCNEGYYVDCNRTISIGEPTNEQRELYDTCREMYEAMIDTIEPGVTGGTVWERAYEVAADAGYENYLNAIYLGHTTGITISEAPVISETETGEISDGQFLNIEPGLFVPDIGSACIENALHVTTDGAVPINEFDIDLLVV